MASTSDKSERTLHSYFKGQDINKSSTQMTAKISHVHREVERINQHNQLKSQAEMNSNKENIMKKKQRILQTLQPSAETPNKLVGSHGSINQAVKKGKNKCGDVEIIQKPAESVKKEIITQSEAPVTVYEDENILSATHKTENQSDRSSTTETITQPSSAVKHSKPSIKDSNSAEEDSSPGEGEETLDQEAYDLMVAEKIPESYWKEVAERRQIALEFTLTENEQLHKEIKLLREENAALSQMAGQAEYFANMLKLLTNDDHENQTVENDSEDADDSEPDNNEVTTDGNHNNTSADELTES